MKKIFATLTLLTGLVLTSCNMPANLKPPATPAPTQDIVSTQVSLLLTGQPSATAPGTSPTAMAPTLASSSTPLPVNTLSPTPTKPQAATDTPLPGDPRSTLGKPTWQDNIESAKNFYLYANDNTKIDFTPGAILLTGVTPNGWLGWTMTYAQKPANFYVDATFKVGDCSGSDLYGLVFRASKDNTGYFYSVTCDGHYDLHGRDFINNTDTVVISSKATDAIISGPNQTNHLGVMAQGAKIGLYANGKLIEEINDSTYANGYIGLLVAANKTPNFTVQMNQISLWTQN